MVARSLVGCDSRFDHSQSVPKHGPDHANGPSLSHKAQADKSDQSQE